MKKLLILLGILAALAAAAYFLRPTNETKSSVDVSDRQFAYEDANDISKIIIHKVDWQPQVFERKGNDWFVNGYLVSDYKIPAMLKGITSTRVENLPPKNALPTIAESMEKNGVHVEVYNNAGKKVRAYTVGPDATNSRCSYMLLDGKQQPYCMNIQGFGQLRSRFVQEVDEWRDVALYRVDRDDITSLKVEYNKDYISSFEINNNRGSYEVIDLGGQTQGHKINKAKVRDYLTEYRELFGEGYDNSHDLRDSISNLLPFLTVTMTKRSGSTRQMKLFPLAEVQKRTDEIYDANDAVTIEKYFVAIKDEKRNDFMVAQQKLLRPIMRPFDYFRE